MVNYQLERDWRNIKNILFGENTKLISSNGVFSWTNSDVGHVLWIIISNQHWHMEWSFYYFFILTIERISCRSVHVHCRFSVLKSCNGNPYPNDLRPRSCSASAFMLMCTGQYKRKWLFSHKILWVEEGGSSHPTTYSHSLPKRRAWSIINKIFSTKLNCIEIFKMPEILPIAGVGRGQTKIFCAKER